MKRQRVLQAALNAFLSYGFKRVTMDDIAKAAEMSRPALYLLFRNKTDIFRAVADHMFELAVDGIAQQMRQPGKLADRLNASIEQVMIEMVRPVRESPHGEELLDLKSSIAADLVSGWHNATMAIFRDAIAADARQRGIDLAARGLTSAGLSEMLLDGLEGMKRRVSDPVGQRDGASQLVRVVELAIKV